MIFREQVQLPCYRGAMSSYYAALSFESYEDFEACNRVMNIRPGDTGTSSDGMFTVMFRTELKLPPGTLVVKTNKSKDIRVRVVSGAGQAVGYWILDEQSPCAAARAGHSIPKDNVQ